METCGNRDLVKQNNAEDNTDETCMQRGNVKKYSKTNLHTKNQKETVGNYRTHNEEIGLIFTRYDEMSRGIHYKI